MDERENPTPFRVGIKMNFGKLPTNQTLKYNTHVINIMLELGDGHRIIDMNMYHLLRKAEDGLCSDIVPQGLRECTPAEIRNSVVEAGRSQWTLVIGSSLAENL